MAHFRIGQARAEALGATDEGMAQLFDGLATFAALRSEQLGRELSFQEAFTLFMAEADEFCRRNGMGSMQEEAARELERLKRARRAEGPPGN